jgi:hypothetical protein
MEGHKQESRWHRLHDWARVRDTATACGVNLWLHGHRHRWYWLPRAANLPFATICVGSSTQTGRWGYHDYTIDGTQFVAQRRVYEPATRAFRDTEAFTLSLE